MIDKNTRKRFVVSGFRDLESQLADCMGYIPFIGSNKYILAPKFIPIISESCGFIESIFKETEVNKGRRYALKDYAKLLEPRLELENTITVFLNSPIFFSILLNHGQTGNPHGGKHITCLNIID